MGFYKRLNFDDVRQQIISASHEMSNHRNVGFIQFAIKQDLYKLKWLLDDILKNGPEFVGENEWILEEEKNRIWEKLKK
jgi:hypothetical protein